MTRFQAELRDHLLRAAVLAPSMHNTQPWLFGFSGDCVDVYRDVARELPAEDPDGRAALLSLGAVVLNLQVAAARKGLRARLGPLPSGSEELSSVRLTLEREASPEVGLLARLYPSVATRRTNRQPFYAAVTTALLREDLRTAAAAEGAELEWAEDSARARWLLRLESDALADDACDPRKVVERRRWVGGERTADGVPSSSLAPGLLANAGTSLAVLSTKTDDQADRLLAGIALQRVWLTATKRRVAMSLLTAAVAHRGLRWMICDPLSGRPEPQALLRLGFGPFVLPTPRRPIAEFLLTGTEES
ncbi:nitroreductase family protein [Flindersiella endophytica]